MKHTEEKPGSLAALVNKIKERQQAEREYFVRNDKEPQKIQEEGRQKQDQKSSTIIEYQNKGTMEIKKAIEIQNDLMLKPITLINFRYTDIGKISQEIIRNGLNHVHTLKGVNLQNASKFLEDKIDGSTIMQVLVENNEIQILSAKGLYSRLYQDLIENYLPQMKSLEWLSLPNYNVVLAKDVTLLEKIFEHPNLQRLVLDGLDCQLNHNQASMLFAKQLACILEQNINPTVSLKNIRLNLSTTEQNLSIMEPIVKVAQDRFVKYLDMVANTLAKLTWTLDVAEKGDDGVKYSKQKGFLPKEMCEYIALHMFSSEDPLAKGGCLHPESLIFFSNKLPLENEEILLGHCSAVDYDATTD